MRVDLGSGRDADVVCEDRQPLDVVVTTAGGTGHQWSLEVVVGDCRVVGHDVSSGTDFGGAVEDRFTLVPGDTPCEVVLLLRAPWRPVPAQEHHLRIRWAAP